MASPTLIECLGNGCALELSAKTRVPGVASCTVIVLTQLPVRTQKAIL